MCKSALLSFQFLIQMFDHQRFYFLKGLFILCSLLFIISFTSGAPNAKVHCGNNDSLFHQARRPHVIIPPWNAIRRQKGSLEERKKERRKKKTQRLEKKRKIPTKSLHISSMSSLHLSHCTDARILYKNRSTTHKSPPAGRTRPGPVSFDPESLWDHWSRAPKQPSLTLICVNKKGSLMLR